FRGQFGGEKVQAGRVAARPIKAFDQAELHWIIRGNKDDRDRRSCRLGGQARSKAADCNHSYAALDQICKESRQPLKFTLGPTILDSNIAPLSVTGISQPTPECGYVGSVRRGAADKSDQWHRRLLRPCHERPRGHAEQRDELAARHSITSSARRRIEVGRARPSAFAVFRFRAKWKLSA